MLTRSIWTITGKDPAAVAQAGPVVVSQPDAAQTRASFAYIALVVFCFLYFYRPEDFIPGLDFIPMAKISGIIAFLGLLFGMLSQGKFKIPFAMKALLALLVQMIFTIPFAIWRGGAFDTVFTKFSKVVIAALLVSMVVTSLKELRRLLWLQVSSVALVTVVSILVRHYRDGRLQGVQKSILENPNDLALNIAMSFPLCIAFMLHARGGVRKAAWIIGMLFMALGTVLTLSRGGLIALIISGTVCVWEYAIRGKRRYMLVVAGVALLVGVGVVASSSEYRARVESIFLGNIEGSHDRGSLDARKAMLKRSIQLSFEHPIFGLGPGNFPVVDKAWLRAHNTYTELSAEAGIPALIIFLIALRGAFRNIALARKTEKYKSDPDFRLFTSALWAGMAAYVTGACFASTEYNLYPFVMIAYTCALLRLSEPAAEAGKERFFGKVAYESVRKPNPAWSR